MYTLIYDASICLIELPPIAPCLPDDVLAVLDCQTNVMNVSWAQTPGSDDYTAWAISTDGHRACCNSTSNSCVITDLQCGKIYEMAVTSSSINCEIIAGSDYKVQSGEDKYTTYIQNSFAEEHRMFLIHLSTHLYAAPCKPENTSIDLNCSSNSLTVKWNLVSTTQNYTVKATSAAGVNSTCESAESSCSFLDLSCGQLYTFTVMGHTNVCMSEMSEHMEKLTGTLNMFSFPSFGNILTLKTGYLFT